ncbi:MAG: transglutaminase domain-containing protein [Bacteroidota bacterium]
MRKLLLRILPVLVFVASGAVMAQTPEIIKKYNAKYPGKEAAAVELYRKLSVDIVNGKPEITFSTSEELIYLGRKPDASQRSVSSSHFMELKKVEAFVLVPEKEKYRSIPVKKFTESTLGDRDVFYDDSKELNFTLSGIEQGSKSIIRSEYKVNDPHMIPSMSVHPYLPVDKCVFEITYPNGLDIGITELNFKDGVQTSEVIKGKHTTRTYTFAESKGLEHEGDGPDWRYFTPEVHVRLKSYQSKDKPVNVLRNVDDLHSWYCTFLDQSKETIEEFRALSDSIVQGCTTDRQKAEKLYQWVQQNVRYIAIENGYMGYIPQKASLVCHNRYGDCKGMSNLLWYLMRAQNLPAYHAWVGTRSLPYSYEKIASPYVDNHMVICYRENGKNLFLDCTHANLPFGMPSPFIQEKESLVTDNCKSFEVVRIDPVKTEDNLFTDSVWVKLNDNRLSGYGKAVLTGHVRMSFLDHVNPKDQKSLQDFCRDYLAKGTNKFLIDSVWVENTTNSNLPLVLNYRFSNPDYALQVDGETLINLNLDKQHGPEKIKKDRKISVEYKYNMRYINTVVFELPAGLQVKDLPSDSHSVTPNFTYHNSYQRQGNTIIRRTEQDRNVLSVQPADFDAWNNFYKLYTAQANIQTVLIRN